MEDSQQKAVKANCGGKKGEKEDEERKGEKRIPCFLRLSPTSLRRVEEGVKREKVADTMRIENSNVRMRWDNVVAKWG